MRTALMTVWAVAAIFAGAVGSSAGVLPLSYETLSYESGAITAVAEEQVVVAGPGVSDMLDAQPRTITSTPSSKMVDLSYAEVEAAFKRAPLVRNDHPEMTSLRGQAEPQQHRSLQALPVNMGDTFTITRNNRLATIAIPQSFSVQFDLFPMAQAADDWRNIFHMTQGGDCCFGNRMPAVWFCHIAAGCVDKGALLVQYYGFPSGGGSGFLTRQTIPQNQWTTIKIIIDSNAAYMGFEASGSWGSFKQGSSFPGQTNLPSFGQVQVFASDPWYTPGAGQLRNIQIAAILPTPGMSLPVGLVAAPGVQRLRMGNLLARVVLPPSYVVSFDIFPIVDPKQDWRNVLLMTNTWGGWGAGQRMPGIWFCHAAAGCPQGTQGFHVCYMATGGQQCVNPNMALPVGRWTTVRVTVDAQLAIMTVRYSGAVNWQEAVGIAVGGVENLRGVNVWMSDPWHVPARGAVRNVNILNFPGFPRPVPVPIQYRADARMFMMGTVLGRVDLPTSFRLRFSVYPMPDGNLDWRSLVHVTTSGNWGPGQRMPGIWFCHHHGCPPMSMHVCVMPTGTQFCVNSGINLPISTWTTVTVTVNNGIDGMVGIMTVRLEGGANGQNSVLLGAPVTNMWTGAVVYASDPWHRAANAQIRDLQIEELTGMTPRSLPITYYVRNPTPVMQGEVLGRVDLPRNYVVQFQINGVGNSDASWRNILHMTISGNAGPGQRIPGLWYCHIGWNLCPANGMHLSFMQDNNNIWLNTPPIKPGVWTTVRIVIDNTNLRMTFQVNGGLSYSNSIAFPAVAMNTGFQAVTVFAGDPWHQQTPAGLLQNFQLWQLGTAEPSVALSQPPTLSPTRWPTRRPVRAVTRPPQAEEIIKDTPAPVRRRRGRPTRRPSIRPTSDDEIGTPTQSPTIRCPPKWIPWRGGRKGPVRACAARKGRNTCPVTWFRLIAASTTMGVVCVPTKPVTPLPSPAPTLAPTGSPLRPGVTANPTTFRPTRRPFRPLTRSPVTSVGCPSRAWMITPDKFCQGRTPSMRNCPVGWSAVRPSTGSMGVTCRRIPAVCPVGFTSTHFNLCMATSAATKKCPATGFVTRVDPPNDYSTTGILCGRLPACPTGFTAFTAGATSGCQGMVASLTTCPTTANSPFFVTSPATARDGVKCGMCTTGFKRMSTTICQAISTRTTSCARTWRRVSRATSRQGIRCAFGPRGASGSPSRRPTRRPSRFTPRPVRSACPRGWTPTAGGSCRAPRGTTTCPRSWTRIARASTRVGVTCRRSRPTGTRSPSRPTRPTGWRSPSRAVSSRCPRGWTLTARGSCRAPRGTTTCPRSWTRIARASTRVGVTCRRSRGSRAPVVTGPPQQNGNNRCFRTVKGVWTEVKCPPKPPSTPTRPTSMCTAVVQGVPLSVPCHFTRMPQSKPARMCPALIRGSSGALVRISVPCSATRGGRRPSRPSRGKWPRRSRSPSGATLIPPNGGLGSGIFFCPSGWTRMQSWQTNRCRAPVGTNGPCPAGMIRTSVGTSSRGVTCGSSLAITTQTGCPWFWRRLSGGRCKAPVGGDICPRRWRTLTAATRTSGVLCGRPRRNTAPSSSRRTQRPVVPTSSGCPPRWVPAGVAGLAGVPGQCRAPVGNTRCPLRWVRTVRASPLMGVTCVRMSCPIVAAGSPTWTAVGSTQCIAPPGIISCPLGWWTAAPATPTAGALCGLGLRAASPTRRPIVGTRRPVALMSSAPTRLDQLTMPCRVCPRRWIRLQSGHCRGPVGGQRLRCPRGMSLVRAGAAARGITCACKFSTLGPSKRPSAKPSRLPTVRSSPRPSIKPITAIPTILGADVAGACPPLPWVFMAGGRCQAPSGVTTCPVGDFRVVSPAVGLVGVVCQKTVPCPVTKGMRWTRERLGQCRAPRGVGKCPRGWRATGASTRNIGVACLAPLDILTRRPTRAPTASPSMRRRVLDPTAGPTTSARLNAPTVIRFTTAPPSTSRINFFAPPTFPGERPQQGRSQRPSAGWATAAPFSVSSAKSSAPSAKSSAMPSAMPSKLPTKQPTLRPSARPSAQPSVLPTMKPSGFEFTFTQVMLKVSLADWDANQGDDVYRQAVCGAVGLTATCTTSVDVFSDSLSMERESRRLQQNQAPQPVPVFGSPSSGIMVTVDVTAPAARVLAARQAVRSGAILSTLQSIGGFWSTIQAQPVVLAGVVVGGTVIAGDPTLQPTPLATNSRAPSAAADNNQQIASSGALSGSVGGLPATTLIAIVVVIVVVMLAVGYVVYTSSKKKPLSALDSYNNFAADANSRFQPHISSSTTRNSRGSRGSRGSFQRHQRAEVELGTAFPQDDQSYATENPGFGNIRRSMDARSPQGRLSLSGGDRQRDSFYARSPPVKR